MYRSVSAGIANENLKAMDYKEYLLKVFKNGYKPVPVPNTEPDNGPYVHYDREPEEDTGALPTEPGKFKVLSLFDKYMFAKSYIRLLKIQLDRSRKQNRVLQDEIIQVKAEMAHLKTLFRKDKRLPKSKV